MTERPYSRYTRAKTWAALHSQHINAGYALVPWSATNNSIWLARNKTPEEAQKETMLLLSQSSGIESFFARKPIKKQDDDWRVYQRWFEQWFEQKPDCLKNAREAVVLAKSSDYHHYHLADSPDFKLVVCGLHDSYLHLPVLEMRTNRRYGARETAVVIGSAEFTTLRATQFGHNILVGALVCGDQTALAFVKSLPERTRRRLRSEVTDLQEKRYQGRPLAFLTDAERQAIGDKISGSLLRYHARRRLKAI